MTGTNRIGWFFTAAAVAGLLGYTVAGEDEYTQHLLMWSALNAVLAVGLRFMLLVGETNIATGAFYGLGAYAAAVISTKWNLPFPLALLAGGVLALGIGAVFGAITLRTKGPYFMLISFAFTEVVRLIYTRIEWLGGNSGMIGIFPPGTMVRLQSGRLAIVLDDPDADPTKPPVCPFYCIITRRALPWRYSPSSFDPIVGIERPSRWNFPDWEDVREAILAEFAPPTLDE